MWWAEDSREISSRREWVIVFRTWKCYDI